MAPRVDGAAVKEIFDTSLNATQLAPFITAANLFINEEVEPNANYSEERLTLIEQWLSAHLAATRDQRVESNKIEGDLLVKYQGKTGMGLSSTFYGQQVLLFDTSDIIDRADEDTGVPVGIHAL